MQVRLVLLLVLGSCWRGADAHRSLPDGISCSSQFQSPDAALAVPNSKISWASYRIFTCDEPIFWLEAQADANQKLAFTALVPVLDRFADIRMSVAFIGPSLFPLNDESSDVPQEIRDYVTTTGMGVALYHSPQDQSTCNHLTSGPMIAESEVRDGRCHFEERFGGSNSWVLLDEVLQVNEAGTYKIAVFVEGGKTAKASFACCDWPEDFVTDYSIPEIDCPFCGTSPKENLAWASHFYEQKTMAPYAGFPPAESCDNPEAQNLMPTDEQCPPITSTGPETQPPSCTLGCNSNGLCHSHNVFGECTHQLAWNLEPKFGEAPVSKVIIFKGDKIVFQATESAHNLFQMTSQQDFDTCDFSDAIAVANVEELFIGYTMTFDEAGTFFFSCGISCVGFPSGEEDITQQQGNESAQCHCTLGQKLTVEVLDSSEGLRCHDHAPFSNEQGEQVPLTCPAGQVLAFATDNPAYGAMDENECAEFCTVPEALNFMVGVQQGSCGDQGFTGASTEKTVKLPNGQDLTVHVKRNEEPSTCHCHSYEEISCPADEVPGDTLYVEHIGEIEEFCTGILDGSEPDCPFECFQPMEVLHLHYLECPFRGVDPTYLAVNATAKCHKAATAPAGTDCPVVTFDGNQKPTEPLLPDTFAVTPIHFHGCMQVNGTDMEGNVVLEKCDSSHTKQQWQYDALTGLIRSGLDDGLKCIQAGHTKMPPQDGGKVRISRCDENNDLQQFRWPSALGSPITLEKYPKYCVTFRGETANLGIDPIIVKKCSWIEKARRDGWMAK